MEAMKSPRGQMKPGGARKAEGAHGGLWEGRLIR